MAPALELNPDGVPARLHNQEVQPLAGQGRRMAAMVVGLSNTPGP
jgi:hypothetical protein